MAAVAQTELQEERSPQAQPGLTIRLPAFSWEVAAYAALVGVAAAMRLWDLGSRAYHHDESLHAYYSWVYYAGRGFMHDPLLHGPFQFHITALGLFLFGDNLVAPRVFPALFGTALVLMPLTLRDYLGRWGALAAAVLLAFSPSILYFSRFIREDIFAIVLDLGLVIALWRYMESRKNRWLYIGAAFLALSFSTKESAYITLAVVGSFFLVWWAAGLGQRRMAVKDRAASASIEPAADSMAADGAEAPKPVALQAQPPAAKDLFQRVRSWFSDLPPAGGVAILLAALSLPLFSAGVGYVVERGFDFTLVNPSTCQFPCRVGAPDGTTDSYVAAGLIAGVLFLVAAALGWAWRGRVWLVIFATFWGVFFLLHTSFLTNMVGMGSGVWQSLGYWIAQQSVERGNQPWYYYFIILPLYETLAFSVAVGGIIAFGRKLGGGFLAWAAAIALIAALLATSLQLLTDSKALYLPLALGLIGVTYLALRRGGKPFDWFLVHWALMSLLLYIVAGEKMPWLLTHLAVPFALLAGRCNGLLLADVDWRAALRTGGIALLFAAPLLMLAIRALVLAAEPERSPIGASAFWGAFAFTGVLLALGIFLWSRMGGRLAMRLLAFSAIGFLAFFTVRSGVQAAYANGDVPRDMLIYTQTSPEVAAAVQEIDRLAAKTGKGDNIPILVDTDDGFGWPWFWYLRHYKNVNFRDMRQGGAGDINADVVVLNASNRAKIQPFADKYGEGVTIPFRQWFPEEEYRGYKASKFRHDFFSAESWSRLFNFYTYRRLSQPLGHIDSVVYYAKGLPA